MNRLRLLKIKSYKYLSKLNKEGFDKIITNTSTSNDDKKK